MLSDFICTLLCFDFLHSFGVNHSKYHLNHRPAEPSGLWIRAVEPDGKTNSFIWFSFCIPFPPSSRLLLISRAWSVSSFAKVHNYVGLSSMLTLQMASFIGTAVSS